MNHGSIQVPCRDIPVGVVDDCLMTGWWNKGSEGMIQFAIGDAILDTDKINCGWDGMHEDECYDRGCCWQPVWPNPDDIPWCFYETRKAISSVYFILQKRKICFLAY